MGKSLQAIQAPSGVTVSLDTTGKYPSLTVTMPKGTERLPKAFVSACHYHAGEHGADIRFVER